MAGLVLPCTSISMWTYYPLLGYVSMSSSTSMIDYGNTCCPFLYISSTRIGSIDFISPPSDLLWEVQPIPSTILTSSIITLLSPTGVSTLCQSHIYILPIGIWPLYMGLELNGLFMFSPLFFTYWPYISIPYGYTCVYSVTPHWYEGQDYHGPHYPGPYPYLGWV